ncbi:type I-E CRISPR-associated protein Cas6/Cse3/CasE [Halomonas sp.]|jgi:CRISPR system Cascade subunit CasE|uniref:type I-E CRISPR-associated protein Cas6/Cse3/CasE n=1 Tax=Halomonas sp. TaxID=1486246 RepID=UPI003568BB87
MYLARLTLDLRNAGARRDLADAYDMHRSLVRAFVADNQDKPPRFLWRLEPESAWREPVVIVQSTCAPDWSSLEAPGYLKKPVESKSVDFDQLFEAERRYRFRLFANPTVTQGGKRFGLASEGAQCQWLDRQAAKAGFEVDTALVTATDVLDVRGGDIRLRQACFEGVLSIRDSTALKHAVERGIGPGKAFGFGLLSVSPR